MDIMLLCVSPTLHHEPRVPNKRSLLLQITEQTKIIMFIVL